MKRINNLKNKFFSQIKKLRFSRNNEGKKKRKEDKINYFLMKYKQNQLEQAYRQKQNQQKLIQVGILIFWNLIFLALIFYYYKLNFYIPISFVASCICFALVYYYPKIIQIMFFITNIVNSFLFSITLNETPQLSLEGDDIKWFYFFFHIQLFFNIAITRSYNFVVNTLSTFVSFIIVWWFLGFNYSWMLFYLCFVIISIDYLNQFTTRRLYYQRQKEKEWREIIHQIVPLKILVSEFDAITMRLNLFDCSTAAQSYIKQQVEDEDKYNKFLERVVLNIDTSKIKFKQFQEQENLKKYLTHRFIMIDDFIKKNEKMIMKNVTNRIKVASNDIRKQFTFQQEKYEEKKLNKDISKLKSKIGTKRFTQFDIRAVEIAQLDEMEGYYYFGDADTDPTKKKKIKVKVAYHSVQNSKPLLVISIEDESLREDIEFYKEEKQKSDQFITYMLENYRGTLIKNLSFFNQGWIVVRANFEEIFRNSLILVNKCYSVYDYFLFLRIRRSNKGISHREQLGLMKSESFNFVSMLKYLIEIFHNIDIVCEIDNDTSIYNDEKRIKQVFISLITNCIKISVSAINVNIYESQLDDIQVIFVHIAFYKDEDNPLIGILDHLDGTESPYVNQIEQIVLQEIIRCIGPFSLKANTSPNGYCEIEFAIYGDLRKFKKIFEIQDQDSDELSKNQNMSQDSNLKQMNLKADQFQRKNKKFNKTFFDLKNFKQMESIVGIPRGSKLVSQELRNQLQPFFTLKDQKCNLEEEEDEEDQDEDNDEENTKYEKRYEEMSMASSKKQQKLVPLEQQIDEEYSESNSSQKEKSQLNYSIKNSEIDNNFTYKTADLDEDSSKKSKTLRSRQNNILEERRSKEYSLNKISSQGQAINYLQTSNENISQGSRKRQNNNPSIGSKDRDMLPFFPKKLTSSFTSIKQNTIEDIESSERRQFTYKSASKAKSQLQNTIEDLETSDRKQLSYRQSSRVKSQLQPYQDYNSSRSLTQNITFALHTETYRSDRNLKGNYQVSSQHSIFDYSKYKEDKSRIGSGINQFDVSTHTIQIEDENDDNERNACNLTFQIEKSELEINDFVPRLK